MKKKLLLATTLIALSLGVSSCGGTENSETNSLNPYFNVTVEDNRSIIAIGEEIKISYELYGTSSSDVTFTSSNTNVLSVSADGVAKGLKAGVATVNVKSVADESLTKDIQIQVVSTLGQKNPQLEEFADSINAYNYADGVRYNANIHLDLGDPKAMGLLAVNLDANLPLTVEVQNPEKTNVHIQADVSRLIDQDPILGIDINTILAKTVGALINSDFDNYTKDEDYAGVKYLDLYSFDSSLNFTVGYQKDFGTEEAPDYRTYLLGEGNVLSVLSPLGDTLLGALLGGDSEETPTEGEDTGLDLGSLLSYEGILSLTNSLYGFFNVETGSDYTVLTLNDNALTIINNVWTGLGIGGLMDLDFNGVALEGMQLPVSFSNLAITVENKAEGENKFSSFKVQLDALNSSEEEYSFLEFEMSQPEELKADYFPSLIEEVNAYKLASQSLVSYSNGSDVTADPKTLIKTLNNISDMESVYEAEETEAITETIQSFLSYYYDDNIDPYLKDLLYPAYLRATGVGYGNGEYVNGRFTLKELNDGDTGRFVFDHLVDKVKSAETPEVTYRSDNSNIISINEDGTYVANGKEATGSVGTGNTKSTKDYTTIYADVSYTNSDGEETSATYKQMLTKYVGEKIVFPATKSTLKSASGFDAATHDISLASNSTFDFKSLIQLPEGASEATYSFKSSDTKIATVDNEGKITTLTSYLESDNETYRTLAGITATVSYKLNDEDVKDTLIVYVSLNDAMAEGKINSSTVEGVTVDATTKTITAKSHTKVELESLFAPSATADEGSVTVKLNGVDSKLYSNGEILAPYISSQTLNEDGEFNTVNSSEGYKVYADITYKVNGVEKTERVYFTLVVDGEAEQDEAFFNVFEDPKFNKDTNTITLTKTDFTALESDPNSLVYKLKVKEGCYVSSLSISDSKIVTSLSERVDGKYNYYFKYVEGGTGKVGAKITIKDAENNSYVRFVYVVVQ